MPTVLPVQFGTWHDNYSYNPRAQYNFASREEALSVARQKADSWQKNPANSGKHPAVVLENTGDQNFQLFSDDGRGLTVEEAKTWGWTEVYRVD